MTGQFSTTSRIHPAYETAKARQWEAAQAELREFMAKADAMRLRLAVARIIETATTETAH